MDLAHPHQNHYPDSMSGVTITHMLGGRTVKQTRNTMENLRAVLEAAGSGFEHVLKTTVYLTDMKDFAAMNEVYRSYFTGDLPARTTVGVVALARPELRVEIEVVDAVP